MHQVERPSARIAFSISYTPSKQRRRLVADLLGAGGTGAVPGTVVQQLSIVTSEAGHDVPALNISVAAAAAVADDVARFAASAAGHRLRELADVVITPIVDVDNVVVGGAGKDQLPIDFNRDWCPLGQVRLGRWRGTRPARRASIGARSERRWQRSGSRWRAGGTTT